MTIDVAKPEDFPGICCYDRHIPAERLLSCIEAGQVLVLKENMQVRGILRWSLFWQTIPFVDLIFLDFSIHGQGLGTKMMAFWEQMMEKAGYSFVMTSTQEDETAWQFYEKLGFHRIGSFLPPDQEAPELIYGKSLI
jgi:GNAT superfamily N-acetyltransferase